MLDMTHLRFFTKATMSEMFERVGFEVKEVAGINSFTANRSRRMAYRRVRPLLPDTDWLQSSSRAIR